MGPYRQLVTESKVKRMVKSHERVNIKKGGWGVGVGVRGQWPSGGLSLKTLKTIIK